MELGQRKLRAHEVEEDDLVFTRDGMPDYAFHAYKGENTNTLGAASLLLNRRMQQLAPKIVLEGAPGQGKSTITQYICQIHRMRLLEKSDSARLVPSSHADSPIKLPFRVDLRDLATWLGRRDPFSPDNSDAAPPNWQKSLEAFLAAQVRYHSGGIDFTQADLVAVTKLCAVLLVLDGLDEVVDVARRQEVVNEIVAGVSRLEVNSSSLQVIVTSRPTDFRELVRPT